MASLNFQSWDHKMSIVSISCDEMLSFCCDFHFYNFVGLNFFAILSSRWIWFHKKLFDLIEVISQKLLLKIFQFWCDCHFAFHFVQLVILQICCEIVILYSLPLRLDWSRRFRRCRSHTPSNRSSFSCRPLLFSKPPAPSLSSSTSSTSSGYVWWSATHHRGVKPFQAPFYLFSSFQCSWQNVGTNRYNLLMNGFEPRTSGVEASDHSTNWATTTAYKKLLFVLRTRAFRETRTWRRSSPAQFGPLAHFWAPFCCQNLTERWSWSYRRPLWPFRLQP